MKRSKETYVLRAGSAVQTAKRDAETGVFGALKATKLGKETVFQGNECVFEPSRDFSSYLFIRGDLLLVSHPANVRVSEEK